MEPVFTIGGVDITLLDIVTCLTIGLIGFLIGFLLRPKPKEDHVALRLQEELRAMRAVQETLQGRLSQMSEDTAKRGDLLQQSLDKRLSSMTDRVSLTLTEQSERNAQHLKSLHTRLEVIDRAQTNIKELAGEVSGLQSILSNKQARGAFGEKQMESIIRQLLDPGSYSLQKTLSNNSRVDALLHLPDEQLDIAVDAKFPLESWRVLVEANPSSLEYQSAKKQFRDDCRRHMKAIKDKYLIPGETYDLAIMFVPSEAIFAELHTNFQDTVIKDSYDNRVAIVSPTTFMATLHTMNSIIKDAAIQEQAALIQAEMIKLKRNVDLLDQRLTKLRRKYDGMSQDMREIDISKGKILGNADKIENVRFKEKSDEANLHISSDAPSSE